MVPELIKTTWIVGQGVIGGSAGPAPGLHIRRELAASGASRREMSAPKGKTSLWGCLENDATSPRQPAPLPTGITARILSDRIRAAAAPQRLGRFSERQRRSTWPRLMRVCLYLLSHHQWISMEHL